MKAVNYDLNGFSEVDVASVCEVDMINWKRMPTRIAMRSFL
jgi:hypothetical protein